MNMGAVTSSENDLHKTFASGPLVQKLDNAIHWIKIYPVVSLIL